MRDEIILAPWQERQVTNILTDLIETANPKLLADLSSGYEKDYDKLLAKLRAGIAEGIFLGKRMEVADLESLTSIAAATHENLCTHSYNYFKTTMIPDFSMGWRNIEWGNMVQLYNNVAFLCSRGSGKSFEFCYAFILWRLYTYNRPATRLLDTIDNRNRKETIMITNERKLGRSHNEKVIEAIQNFDELKEKINPRGKATLGVDRIVTEQGAKLDVKSAFSFIRGRHVGGVVVDDFPDESSIYSKEMREKYKQIFYGAIKYIVEPYGHLIVSGTPYHQEDIYGTLRKDDAFMIFEYPAIFPDGSLLAPDRYSFDQLMEKKKTDGNIVFSQEVLVSPITDASSLFPYEILKRSIDNMDQISLCSNIESYPIKFTSVAIGCDFAISGGIAADFTVFTVWGLTSQNQYYLIECWRKQGAKHQEQLAMIKSMDNRFKPNKIICEANNFQIILSDLARDMGVRTIEEFTTHKGNKRNMKDGLPSLAAIFERDEIKIPYKHGRSKENADWLLGEFNSVGFNQDKGTLESISEHDDGVMSTYMAIQYLRKGTQNYKAYLV